MSHGVPTHFVDALRSTSELSINQQQAIHTCIAARQLHLQAYNHAQFATAEAATAGDSIRAQEASNQALSSFRAAQI